MKIKILKEDITPYVYFVCSMAFESEKGMHGALGSKNDFIGGIFDRWINIIPESIIFNKKILLDVSEKIKEVTGNEYQIEVFSDFYKYKPNLVGIAPDVLGLKVNDMVIPFVKYDDTQAKKEYWVPEGNSPQIEVKSFKESQYLVSLRNQNYDNKYLVMVETNLSIDYLLPFFDKDIFTNEIFNKLAVPDIFIKSNEQKLLSQTEKIVNFNELGTIDLLLITTAQDFMENSTKCFSGESPKYVKDITIRKVLVKSSEEDEPIASFFDKRSNGLFRENDKFRQLFKTPTFRTLDVYFDNPNNIIFKKANKNNVIVYAKENAKINNFKLNKGSQYSINFNVLDRSNANQEVDMESSAGSEYFFDKQLLRFISDEHSSLVKSIVQTILERIK